MRASEFTKQELDEKVNPRVVEPGFTAEKRLGNRYVMKAEARYTGEPGDDLRGLIIKVYDTKARPTMLNWGIGMTRFVARQDPTTQDWYLVSSTTHVDDRYQRQGLASAMYNWARELGNDIEPSSNRTKMGKHFWEKGAGAGREFVDQPPETAAPPAIPTSTAAGPAKAQSLRDRLIKMFTEERVWEQDDSEVKSHDFMAGHCHVMALALKQLHPDWQIRAHVGWDDDAADDTEYRVDHVYTVAPDGTAYDCRGRFSNEQQLVGPDTTGGVDTQYVNFGPEEIKQAMLRGELKRFSKQDLTNAMQTATQAGKQGVAEGKQPGKPVVDAILKVIPVAQEIWFHGSRATGSHRKNSDTDILVIVPDDLVGDQYLGAVRILQKLSTHFDNHDIQPTKAGTNIHRIAQEEGQLLWSNKQDISEAPAGYKEIEFVCVNPQFPDATDPALQKKMYRGLKQIDGVVPLWQEWGDYSESQASLSAIYQGSKNRDKILSLAKQLGVEVDLEQAVSADYVDRAMRGEHEGQQGLTEEINPDCFDPAFNDTQIFDGLTYRATAEKGYDDKTYFQVKVFDSNFQQVGLAKFSPTKRGLVSAMTSIQPEYQGQGLARNIYAYVRSLGNTIAPSRNQLPPGKAMWDSWKKSGDAKYLMRNVAERKQSPLEDFEGLQFRMVNDNDQLFVNAFDSSGGNELGHVTFDIGDGKELDPQNLYVKHKFRSQGIARLMYDFVKSKGYKIQRSWDQTDAGAGFWDKHRGEERVWEQDVAEAFVTEDAMMGKLEDSGKIVRILKKAHTVPFSDEKNWLLIDTDPAKGNKGLGLKWVPADTRFTWVRPYKETVDENFADGRNPQDKGDSKRHGINTKASVTSLRKTAKQGGRKGQLAHWLANMKSGRAKKK